MFVCAYITESANTWDFQVECILMFFIFFFVRLFWFNTGVFDETIA